MRSVLQSGSRCLRPVPALAALALLLVLPATAGARTGAAEVREGPRGGPCFTITPREERQGIPEFQSITVSDGPRPVWKMAVPKERSFPLGFAMCVPYGGKVASLPRTEAANLQPGRVYNLHIEARPGAKGPTALVYQARFCLARQRDGSTAVHQIMDGDREGKHLFGCLPRLD